MNSSTDYFKSMAKDTQKEVKREAESRTTTFSGEYPIWRGFESAGEGMIVRLVDPFFARKPSDFASVLDEHGERILTNTSARLINVVHILDKNNKFFWAKVPRKDDEPNHFYWRMYDTVLKKEYVNDPEGNKNQDGTIKKIGQLVHAETHPELVDRFLTNGYSSSLHKNKYSRGWKAKECFVANIIDRSALDLHREKNKTFLITKAVAFNDDRSIQYLNEYGIPAYGFQNQLLDLIASYGRSDRYDIYIERTGEKDNPWKVKNASAVPAEVPDHYHEFISQADDLTDEEKSWERYDLDKIMGPTNVIRWFNKTDVILKQIDAAFGTNFYDEIRDASATLKIELEKESKENDANGSVPGHDVATDSTPTATDSNPTVETTQRRRKSMPVAETEVTWKDFEGIGFEGQKHFGSALPYINSVDAEGNITWADNSEELLKCSNEECDFSTPGNSEIRGCIACGEDF